MDAEAIARRFGWIGWVGVATAVLAYDAWALRTANQTMSDCYHQALGRHPATVGACTAVLVCHLTRWPRALSRVDPFRLIAAAIEPKGAS